MFNPYPINKQPDGTYLFTSDFGIDYLVTFEISTHATVGDFRSTVYEFSFYGSSEKLPVDSRVVDTVINSLRELFKDPFAVLLYVCESLDGRQLARKRTFEHWFNLYNQQQFERYDYAIDASGVMLYASVIVPATNPEKEALLEEFGQTYQLYSSYK